MLDGMAYGGELLRTLIASPAGAVMRRNSMSQVEGKGTRMKENTSAAGGARRARIHAGLQKKRAEVQKEAMKSPAI